MRVHGLQSLWGQLAVPKESSELQAREISSDSGVWAGVDHRGQKHLLVEVAAGGSIDESMTHGMTVGVIAHQPEGRPRGAYLDLACLDDSALETFDAVADDVATDAIATPISERLYSVAVTLSRWKWFWGVDPARMSQRDVVGLFGELWFMARWAGAGKDAVDAWTASDGARHDFQWRDRSVEIKTTSMSGAIVHDVQNLDQLSDPESGRLFLFSLQIARDALAQNTLASLIQGIADHLGGDPATRDSFWRKLALRGYTPAQGVMVNASYRVSNEALYAVGVGFPRLTRATFPGGLPAGISSVSYEVEMSACADWLCGSSPSDWLPDPAGD